MKESKYAGTQTEKNLMAAFAGESEARNKYTYFASNAQEIVRQNADYITLSNEEDGVAAVVEKFIL